MLQRAASNAYSWWWASHIRTKQSKWLEQSLQDMEEKVGHVLNLIQNDGDSFARRAEMYYKQRPEFISFVEDSYRAFRALAERYDKLSTELQNANTTIAQMFPDQVPFEMDEDDEYGPPPPRMPKNFPQMPPAPNAPKIPKTQNKNLKGLLTTATNLTTATKKMQGKKSSKRENSNHVVAKSGLTKEQAVAEIDKLQKDMLALQTMKEFVKSSYEKGLEKYWGIENQITEMQQRVCTLQDEFGVGSVIEDDEARTLMAEAALKSCQETLAQLQERQDKSTLDAKTEGKRIEDARQKIQSLKHEFLAEKDEGYFGKDVSEKTGEKCKSLGEEKNDLGMEEGDSNKSFTVTELAEKIDKLVNKVIKLEGSVSSQTVLIERLRSETDDLQSQIKTLEEDKATLIDGTQNLNNRLKEMEAKLQGVENLNQNVENQNTNLQTHFTQARSSLDHLSKKLQSVKPEEDVEVTESAREQKGAHVEAKLQQEEKQKDVSSAVDDSKFSKASKIEKMEDKREEGENKSSDKELREEDKVHDKSEKCAALIPEDVVKKQDQSQKEEDVKKQDQTQKEDEVKKQDQSQKEDEGKKQEQSQKEEVKRQDQSQKADEVKKQDQSQKEDEVKKQDQSQKVDEVKKQDQSQKEDEAKKQELSQKEEILLKTERKEGETTVEEDLNWQQMLLNGDEDREKILLTEYTTILRNYKDVKKKLSDQEKQNQGVFQLTVQVRDLRNAISKRDQEIHSLRQKLNLLQGSVQENEEFKVDDYQVPSEDNIKEIMVDKPKSVSVIEEKLRMDIDAILDENLDFWLRFSTAFHQVQKFRTEVEDLQSEIAQLKLKKKKDSDGKSNTSMFTTDIKSDVRPIYKHLREIKTELTVWLEQSVKLKEELQRRLTSLGNIQQEISMALKEGVEEEEIRFTSHQAAKFQGEILNMQQENNKVNEELQAGLDHASALQLETEKTLTKLEEEFGLNESNNRSQEQLDSPGRNRIPLRSFIFGTKPPKKKQSIFACMHHHRKFDSKGLSL